MDGRRRLLRSLSLTQTRLAPGAFALPTPASGALTTRAAHRLAARPRAKPARRAGFDRLLGRWRGGGATFGLVVALFLSTGVYGAVKGGHYDAFVAQYGEPADVLARALGFGVDAVTIAGQSDLSEAQILNVAGIGPRNSLPFLDAAKIREKLQQLAIVKEASVTKLYPDRLLIEIEARQPAALWQKDGSLSVVAADGVAITPMRDRRNINLPLIVGDDANARLGEYLAVLDAAGDLRDRIRAGVLISGRRWNLKMTDGVDVLLPESDPQTAVETLVRLQRQSHVLDRGVLSLDLRQHGRMVARMTEDAADERANVFARKHKAKGGET